MNSIAFLIGTMIDGIIYGLAEAFASVGLNGVALVIVERHTTFFVIILAGLITFIFWLCKVVWPKLRFRLGYNDLIRELKFSIYKFDKICFEDGHMILWSHHHGHQIKLSFKLDNEMIIIDCRIDFKDEVEWIFDCKDDQKMFANIIYTYLDSQLRQITR